MRGYMLPPIRCLVLGPAPGAKWNYEPDPQPLSGRSGKRLADCCGLGLSEFLALYDRRNLIDYFPGKRPSGRGDITPAPVLPLDLLNNVNPPEHKIVVGLGRTVAEALGIPRNAEWFKLYLKRRWIAVAAPHPSGMSLWWNDKRHVEQANEFWSTLTRLIQIRRTFL